ncbi:MAG: long-chain fatty acid--CoA ligase, partial [Candidatus Latescibacteria bacterium]|nr:long-chain fatty acid--CoA ligase [Candidatus Latescibacterota bacterium]
MNATRPVSEDRSWFSAWPGHLPHHLEYPLVSATWILERTVDRFPDRTAVIFVDHESLGEICSLTYRELWTRSCSLAAGIRRLGVNKGDRVAVILPNSPAMIIAYYGIWLAGAAIAPCNVLASEKEIEFQVDNCGARLLIAADALAPSAAGVAEKFRIPLVAADVDGGATDRPEAAISFEELTHSGEASPEDVEVDPRKDMAVLLYTGGTTGEPKGAELTHTNIVANTIQFAEWYAFEPGEETCICTIPMSHSGGMSGVMNVPLYAGATLVVMKRFRPESVTKSIENYRATRFFGVPTMYVSILNCEESEGHDLSSLKACRTNAAPLPASVKEAFDRFAGKEVLIEGYGLTEASPLTHANPPERAKPGSIGIPLPDTDAKVIDLRTGEDVPVGSEGELVLRGPQLMKAYWGNPEATAKAMEGGWFHTGDVAKMDDDGYFYIVDRLKDMINSGGYKVWPRDVEEVLYSHPQLQMAVVIGVPDDYYGETVKACIVPKEEVRGKMTAEEIIAFCKARMSSYKAPRIVEFRDSLPISPQGKVL